MISMIVKESQTVVYQDLNSTAIKSVSITEDICTVVFNSSDKEYNYTIIDKNFEENLQNTIKNSESVGKFITSSIKSENIQQINTNVQ
jgi:hypothetical protein